MSVSEIRLFILERSPKMMIRLLSFFESKLDIRVVEANQDVNAFLSEAGSFEMKTLMGRLSPDVIIVDLCEPIKHDLIILAKIREMSFVPVIAFTSLDLTRKEVAEMGFYSVVHRPAHDDENDLAPFNRMLYHIRNAAYLNAAKSALSADRKGAVLTQPAHRRSSFTSSIRLVAIGASAGGTEALMKLVSGFPEDMPCVLIVQHITKGFAGIFAEHLSKKGPIPARVAFDGAPIQPNIIYVAPDDAHMRVERCGIQYTIRCTSEEKISGHRPSIDAMFSSVAASVGRFAIGVILTGMGKDGACGLLEMRQAGAATIGQDEATSLIYGMPKAAYTLGAVEKQLPLGDIAGEISDKISK
ncbi:MAG: CheB methylesterase domain-containing protein [Cloacibacillus sp.]